MQKFIKRLLLSSLISFVVFLVLIKFINDTSWLKALVQALIFIVFLDAFMILQGLSRRMLITNVLFHKYALDEIEQYDPILKREKKNYTVYKLVKKKWPFNRVSFRKSNYNLYIEAPFKIAERMEELNHEKAYI